MSSRCRILLPALSAALLFAGQAVAEAGFLLSGQESTLAAAADAKWVEGIRAGSDDAAHSSQVPPPVESPPATVRLSAVFGQSGQAPVGGMSSPASGSSAEFAPFGATIVPAGLAGEQTSRWLALEKERPRAIRFGSSLLRPPRAL